MWKLCLTLGSSIYRLAFNQEKGNLSISLLQLLTALPQNNITALFQVSLSSTQKNNSQLMPWKKSGDAKSTDNTQTEDSDIQIDWKLPGKLLPAN